MDLPKYSTVPIESQKTSKNQDFFSPLSPSIFKYSNTYFHQNPCNILHSLSNQIPEQKKEDSHELNQ